MNGYSRLTRVVAVAACATLSWAPSASAQLVGPLSPPVPDARLIAAPALLAPVRAPATQASNRRRRMRFALLGSLIGIAAGVGIAAATGPHHCQCDDPGLEEAVIGYAVGAVVGASVGAAMPASTNPACGFGSRLAPALLGGTLGGAVGIAVAIGPQAPIGFFTTPFGASYGASRILRRCLTLAPGR